MGEERQLLAHQRPVDAVLAGDLAQQSAQLGRALARRAGAGRGDQRAEPLQRHVLGRQAEQLARALQQPGALLLEPAAAAHLGLDLGQLGEHALGVALADRLALREHEPQQTLRRVELMVEMGEQLRLEHGVDHGAVLFMVE